MSNNLILAASPSPLPSEIFALISLLVISIAVLLILRYFLPLRQTPAFYLVPIFFAIFLPASIVLLVPIDLASSAITEDVAARGIWLPERLRLVAWRITYWLTFALTWFILPILAEYSDSGYREPNDRLKYSLRQNAQFHAMVLGLGLVGLIYIFISYGISLDSLRGVAMALAYCWGLALAIYLMGHGLVSIPRRLFRHANIADRLRRIQTQAPALYEKMEDSLMALEDVETQISELKRRKVGSARDFRDWIDELVEMANLPASVPGATASLAAGESRVIPTVITEKYMADLTRNWIRAKHSRCRFVKEWHDLIEEAARTQALLDSAASKKLERAEAAPHAPWWDRVTILTPFTRFIYYYYVIPYFSIFVGVVLSVASACIVWSEVVKFVLPRLSVIQFTVVHHWVGDLGQIGFAGQVVSAFWIFYMCTAALTSMTEVKVWRGRALVRRNTAHESAFWYAGQVAKLSVPLSYNFMTLLSPTIYKETEFYELLGRFVDLTPLGRWFDYLFPIFILFPVLATLFGLYKRVKRLFGFGLDIIDEDDEVVRGYGTGSWREGRDLLEREINGTHISRRREDAWQPSAGGRNGVRSAPVLSVPGGNPPSGRPGASSGVRSPLRTSSRTAHGDGSSSSAVNDTGEDEGFFQLLGHRMKNTIDTLDTPNWLQGLGEGFKKPKWMGNESGSNDRPGGNFGQWFAGSGRGGGSSGEGRIRL